MAGTHGPALPTGSLIGSVAAVTNFSGNETKVNFDYENLTEMVEFARKLAVDKAGQERISR